MQIDFSSNPTLTLTPRSAQAQSSRSETCPKGCTRLDPTQESGLGPYQSRNQAKRVVKPSLNTRKSGSQYLAAEMEMLTSRAQEVGDQK